MTVRVTGQQEIGGAFARFRAAVKAEVSDELVKATEGIRSQVVIDINEQKPNPDYDVPHGATGRRAHIPAPEGGPPNADTGNLSARYTTEFVDHGARLVANVVAGTIYAFWLEFGTRRMGARPHLHPRYNEAAPKLMTRLRDVLDKAAKQTTGRR